MSPFWGEMPRCDVAKVGDHTGVVRLTFHGKASIRNANAWLLEVRHLLYVQGCPKMLPFWGGMPRCDITG